MPFTSPASLARALLFLGSAAACLLENEVEDLGDLNAEDIPDSQCTPSPDGGYTFALTATQVAVPTTAGGFAAGISGSKGFTIFDSKCNAVGAFAPEGNNCGTPYEINYFDGKPLVVDRIDWNAADPFFRFNFDGQTFQPESCTSTFTDGGLRPVTHCKVSFNVGTCTIPNIIAPDEVSSSPETKDALCTPQASGNYQLALDTRFSIISLYDSDCYEVGLHRVADTELRDGCYNYMTFQLDFFGADRLITVRNLELNAYAEDFNEDGNPAFTFEFDGRSYGSTDDWCSGCSGQGSDDELNQGCKCGFYVG